MSFKVNKVIQETADGEVKFPDGSKLQFKYRPYAYTPNHEDAVTVAREDEKAGSTLKAMIIPLVAWWDVVIEEPLLDANGEPMFDSKKRPLVKETPVPIDKVGLGLVPIKALNMIMSQIIDDMSPGETKSETSEGSFG